MVGCAEDAESSARGDASSTWRGDASSAWDDDANVRGRDAGNSDAEVRRNPDAGHGAPGRDGGVPGPASDAAIASDGGGEENSNPETGRLVGITAAHNAVRAAASNPTPMPALPPLVWSPTLAAYAQEWADHQAATACDSPQHRSTQELRSKGYGENFAVFGSSRPGNVSDAQKAVSGWAAEAACWTYGKFHSTDSCDLTCSASVGSLSGCGHYTQLVWRGTTEVGCGVATCQAKGFYWDLWYCNYSPAGNIIDRYPY